MFSNGSNIQKKENQVVKAILVKNKLQKNTIYFKSVPKNKNTGRRE